MTILSVFFDLHSYRQEFSKPNISHKVSKNKFQLFSEMVCRDKHLTTENVYEIKSHLKICSLIDNFIILDSNFCPDEEN